MQRLHDVRQSIAHNWNDEKFGEFSIALQKATGSQAVIDSGVQRINALIDEMIEGIKKYNAIKF